jgi:hypothetical protein
MGIITRRGNLNRYRDIFLIPFLAGIFTIIAIIIVDPVDYPNSDFFLIGCLVTSQSPGKTRMSLICGLGHITNSEHSGSRMRHSYTFCPSLYSLLRSVYLLFTRLLSSGGSFHSS